MQAPEADFARAKAEHGLDDRRAMLMAMLRHLDDGVGALGDALRAARAWDDTLLFFLSDNGGSAAYGADNRPLRGHKHTL